MLKQTDQYLLVRVKCVFACCLYSPAFSAAILFLKVYVLMISYKGKIIHFSQSICYECQLLCSRSCRKCVKLNHLIFFGVGVMSATESNGILFNFALCVPKYAGPVVIEPGVPIASPDADSKNPILAQAIPISNSNNT